MVFGPWGLHSAGEPRGIKWGLFQPVLVYQKAIWIRSFPDRESIRYESCEFLSENPDPTCTHWRLYQHHRIHGTGTYIYLRENHKFGPNVGSKYTVRPMESADVLMCWSSWSSWFSSPGFEFTQSLSKGNKLVFEVSTPSEKYAEVKMGSSSPIFGMSIP